MAKKEKEAEESCLRGQHKATLWAHFVNVFLGFWLLSSALSFPVAPYSLFLSDLISSLFLIVFGLLSLSYRIYLAPFIVALTGLWLSMAPLLFWAENSFSYNNDTIIGALAIAFSLLIPGMPHTMEEKGHGIPPGWRYNPSSWIQRIPIIALAFLGWMISKALAAYQLGYVDTIWDPVFGSGTKDVITSNISKMLPVPDAGLGALAYTLEVLLGCKGGEARWRTMPWLVVFFTFLVVPLGIVTILLVVSQPLVVGAWCFLCLITATSMLLMVLLTLDEMIAVFEFLIAAKREGQSLWRVFWRGGDIKGTKEDRVTPSFSENPLTLIKTWHFGLSFPLTLVASVTLGVFLMLTPYLFSLEGGIGNVDHLVGALVIVIGSLAFVDRARKVRYALLALALVLFMAPWFYGGAILLHVVVGAALAVLTIFRAR